MFKSWKLKGGVRWTGVLVTSCFLLATVAASSLKPNEEEVDGREEMELSSAIVNGTISGKEVKFKPSEMKSSRTSVLPAIQAATNLTTNAGEVDSHANSSYTAFEGDSTEDDENEWAEEGPRSGNRYYTEGKTFQTQTTGLKGAAGHDNNNNSYVWAVNDDNGGETYGKNSTKNDATFGYAKSDQHGAKVTDWSTGFADGSVSVGATASKNNNTGYNFTDVNAHRSNKSSSSKYKDGTLVYLEHRRENGSADNYKQTTNADHARSKWSTLGATGGSTVGVISGVEESNATVGNSSTKDKQAKVWDAKWADGTIHKGNVTKGRRTNHTISQEGQGRNNSQDISNMNGDGDISLLKSKAQKEAIAGQTSNDVIENSNAAYFAQKADGSKKVGIVKHAKTEHNKQSAGNLKDNSNTRWTNFTTPGKAHALPEKPERVVPSELKELALAGQHQVIKSEVGRTPATHAPITLRPDTGRAHFRMRTPH